MAEDELRLTELKDLPEMSRHTEVSIGSGVRILKVVGGWIYWKQVGTRDTSMGLAGVFVPESPK